MKVLHEIGIEPVPRPDDAHIRYEHRMAPLRRVVLPNYVSYEQYNDAQK